MKFKKKKKVYDIIIKNNCLLSENHVFVEDTNIRIWIYDAKQIVIKNDQIWAVVSDIMHNRGAQLVALNIHLIILCDSAFSW